MTKKNILNASREQKIKKASREGSLLSFNNVQRLV